MNEFWKLIVERLLKLICVKSIATLVLTGGFTILALRGWITSDQFLTIFTVVISFYFGTQKEKKSDTTQGA